MIEIFIDPDNNGGISMQNDDYRYTVNLNNMVLDGNGFHGWGWNGSIVREVKTDGTLNNNNDADIGYTIEIAIPWSDLEITPVAGKILGLQIGICDRDEVGGYEYFGWPIANSTFNNPDGWAKVALVGSLSHIITTEVGIHEKFELSQNYPNPFNPETTFKYILAKEGKMSLIILDMLGREVRNLVDDYKNAGYYSVRWNGRDNYGNDVSTGIYFCQMKKEGISITKKVMLMR